MPNQTLLDLKDNLITKKEAYKQLYETSKPRTYHRAHFVKIKVRVPDDPAANRILRIVLALPIPLVFARIGLKFIKNEDDLPLSKEELFKLVTYRGISVQVNSKSGEKVYIKTY